MEIMEAPLAQPVTQSHRLEQVLQRATDAYAQPSQQWITFFREILGPDGIVCTMFPTAAERQVFEQSEEHIVIQRMLTTLRAKSGDSNTEEPTRVITVRLPKSVHESLKQEAHLCQTSMNQLCISKLLQLIDQGLVPNG